MDQIEPGTTSSKVTDWNGTTLSKKALKIIAPNCIVRVVVKNRVTEGWEKIYFKVTKVKDGTVWGIAQDTYRLMEQEGIHVGISSGKEWKFKLKNIIEIPISWQPKSIQKQLTKHLQD